MFIERTHYYAKPGMADEVRRTRARACDARADSPEFESVRKHMRTCYDRFDRHFEEVVDG